MSSGLWPCLRRLRPANREQSSGRRMPESSMKIWATYWMCSERSPDRRREIFWHRFSAYLDRFTLLLALDNNPALRNILDPAGLWSGRSKL